MYILLCIGLIIFSCILGYWRGYSENIECARIAYMFGYKPEEWDFPNPREHYGDY